MTPALTLKAWQLQRELRVWAKQGFPIADEAQRTTRAAACNACSFWNEQGNAGLGECRAPGCGCTRFKWWLATAKCTHPDGSKWPMIKAE